MLKVYITAIAAYLEGEDIEVLYSIYRDDELLMEKRYFKDYQKPSICEHVAIIEALKEFKEFDDEEVEILFNNPALLEQLRGTSTLRDSKAKNMARRINERIDKLDKHVYLTNVSVDKENLEIWKKRINF